MSKCRALRYSIDIEVHPQNAIDYNTPCEAIAAVEIDSTYKRFERIASH